MALKKITQKNNVLPERKIISDIRPGLGKISRPFEQVEKKTLPKARTLNIIDTEDISFLKSDQNEPLRIKEKRPKGPRVFIAVIIIVGACIGAYVYWTSSLTLAITRKRTNFDLGPGIKITLPAKEFSTIFVKRGEGESRDTKKFSQKASGTIIVYNNYNAEFQTLLAGTRFLSPQGFIYRTSAPIIVPGKRLDQPGSIEVIVTADQPGEKYNIDATDFKIPGFSGTPKYEKFFARGKDPMKGGATGEGKVVGKTEADKLLADLEPVMQSELKKNFESSISDAYVTFPSQFQYVTTLRLTDPPVGSPGEKFFGEVRGEAKTLGIDRGVYSDTLARTLFKDDYRQGAVTLYKSSAITFRDINFDWQAKTVTMAVSGRAIFEWNLNKEELKSKVLKAKNEEELNSIFAQYPAVFKVEAVFTPRFLKHIPRDQGRVVLNVD